MCGQHNIRASAGDSTGQNTKDTHPIPGEELKFLTPPGIEPGPPGWKAGTLPTTPRRRIKSRTRVRKSRYRGETLQVPIHCCDVTKLPYWFSGELYTSPLHCKLLFVYTHFHKWLPEINKTMFTPTSKFRSVRSVDNSLRYCF